VQVAIVVWAEDPFLTSVATGNATQVASDVVSVQVRSNGGSVAVLDVVFSSISVAEFEAGGGSDGLVCGERREGETEWRDAGGHPVAVRQQQQSSGVVLQCAEQVTTGFEFVSFALLRRTSSPALPVVWVIAGAGVVGLCLASAVVWLVRRGRAEKRQARQKGVEMQQRRRKDGVEALTIRLATIVVGTSMPGTDGLHLGKYGEMDAVVKVMRGTLAQAEDQALALKKLRHPHLAAFSGLHQLADRSVVLVWEACEASAMEVMFGGGGVGDVFFPAAARELVVRQVWAAMVHLHGRGVAHGGLWPGVVLLKSGVVKVIDACSIATGVDGGPCRCSSVCTAGGGCWWWWCLKRCVLVGTGDGGVVDWAPSQSGGCMHHP